MVDGLEEELEEELEGENLKEDVVHQNNTLNLIFIFIVNNIINKNVLALFDYDNPELSL